MFDLPMAQSQSKSNLMELAGIEPAYLECPFPITTKTAPIKKAYTEMCGLFYFQQGKPKKSRVRILDIRLQKQLQQLQI